MQEEIKDQIHPLNETSSLLNTEEGDEYLDRVIVPNTGSSGGSFSGPHHRKFVCSSSGGGASRFVHKARLYVM